MQKMTITEALAYLKTNEKKLQKKRESVSAFLYRSNGLIKSGVLDHLMNGFKSLLKAYKLRS